MRQDLIEREIEVTTLTLSEVELKESLELTQESLATLRADSEGRKEEQQLSQKQLVNCETVLRTEVALLNNEVKLQINDIKGLMRESAEIEVHA